MRWEGREWLRRACAVLMASASLVVAVAVIRPSSNPPARTHAERPEGDPRRPDTDAAVPYAEGRAPTTPDSPASGQDSGGAEAEPVAHPPLLDEDESGEPLLLHPLELRRRRQGQPPTRPTGRGPAWLSSMDARPGATYRKGLTLTCRGHSLRMTLTEAEHVDGTARAPADIAAHEEGDVTSYANVLPGVDSYVTRGASEAEEWLDIRAPEWRSMTWLVASDSLRLESKDGSLAAVDPAGRTIFRLKEVVYATPDGTGHVAAWSWDEQRGGLTVEIPPGVGPILLDPGWVASGSMSSPRHSHAVSLLPTEGVLVIGGFNGLAGSTLSSCEIFNVQSGTWTATASLATPRRDHTTAFLDTGLVLVAGGMEGSSVAGVQKLTCELYDPIAGTWSPTGSIATGRFYATATTLLNGKILLAGGYDYVAHHIAACEIYDPATGTWSAAAPMAMGRYAHTATRLPDGRVLVTGGATGSVAASGNTATCEIYNPILDTWTAAPPLTTPRGLHTATSLQDGKVLIAGGVGAAHFSSCQVFDSATGLMTVTGSMTTTRNGHTANLLPNGKVLVAGGEGVGGFRSSTEIYDPAAGTWAATASMSGIRGSHTSVLLPSSRIIVIGGSTGGAGGSLSTSEIYDPELSTQALTPVAVGRSGHADVLLPDGKVLVTGGRDGAAVLPTAMLYDAASATWTAASAMSAGRADHAAILMEDGRVLVSGGEGAAGALTSAEIYDPGTDAWTAVPAMAGARAKHRGLVLPNGKILVAGGEGALPGVPIASCEVFDPLTSTWVPAAPMAAPRANLTATLLGDRRVLASGGSVPGASSTCETYDYVTDSWSPAGALATARTEHKATLLPDGSVLVTGGENGGGPVGGCEVYSPTTDTWTATGALGTARAEHTATLLPIGLVVVAGGRGAGAAPLAGAELYDPALQAWRPTTPMADARVDHAATLLPTGKVLLSSGTNAGGVLPTSSLYDWTVETAGTSAVVATVNASGAYPVDVPFGAAIDLAGAQFTSATGPVAYGWNNSSSNQPTIILMGSDQYFNQGAAGWAAGSTVGIVAPPQTNHPDRPQGYYLLFAVSNGTVSDGRMVRLMDPNAGPVASAVAGGGEPGGKRRKKGGCFVASLSGLSGLSVLLGGLLLAAALTLRARARRGASQPLRPDP